MDEFDKIEGMILNGSLEVSGIDMQSGDVLYQFTDQFKNKEPELHNEFSRYFHQQMMSLWQKGFIEMDVTEQNPIVVITEKALVLEDVKDLDTDEQTSLTEVLKALGQDEQTL